MWCWAPPRPSRPRTKASPEFRPGPRIASLKPRPALPHGRPWRLIGGSASAYSPLCALT
jgi:hypothetical protein